MACEPCCLPEQLATPTLTKTVHSPISGSLSTISPPSPYAGAGSVSALRRIRNATGSPVLSPVSVLGSPGDTPLQPACRATSSFLHSLPPTRSSLRVGGTLDSVDSADGPPLRRAGSGRKTVTFASPTDRDNREQLVCCFPAAAGGWHRDPAAMHRDPAVMPPAGRRERQRSTDSEEGDTPLIKLFDIGLDQHAGTPSGSGCLNQSLMTADSSDRDSTLVLSVTPATPTGSGAEFRKFKRRFADTLDALRIARSRPAEGFRHSDALLSPTSPSTSGSPAPSDPSESSRVCSPSALSVLRGKKK
eukprot:Hpha_TRINITY_DN10537_c0_g1::TRINITY_DN10537_c0_g1_i1::g.31409::m.31409